MAKSKQAQLSKRAGAEKTAELPLDRGPAARVDLFFTHQDRLAHVDDPIWQDVSALAVTGRSIFCTCDETSTIERVSFDPKTGRAGEHTHFVLGETFDLPEGPGGEMDIEGLAVADGYLWICGSHSLKRDKPEDDGLKDMEDIDWDANRGFLGKVPLLDRGGGVFDLVAAIEPLDGAPARAARMVPMRKSRKTPIRKMLAKDKLIGPFMDHPCKENGFDIEGLAVTGNTVLLGLRGPVVGSYAMIVRMEMKDAKNGFLKPRKLDGGKRYRLQAIDLDGQGIRDMHWQDGRLLILSGATTDLEALQSVFAIEDYDPERNIYEDDALARVLNLPAIRGSDHAEGIAPIEIDGVAKLLVAYDSPHEDRTDAKTQRLSTDMFELASARSASPKPRAAGGKG
ncbi:MAG TPA: DUF3616 domain-containing protein [Aurantimonas coralicida]|uniref:DUF3616 domain-containing protein n=2 Tax=root TaxID=1 RepID=A0A9C9TIV1_9HYPH|nr:DUF3616 domain-containing protein [Aurantimonas coralicida]HEU02925.1 DUF3616 domain-containing protein [Aurantimonas coralicida]